MMTKAGINVGRVLKALTTRLLFAAHAIFCIWQVVIIKADESYWLMAVTLLCMFIEGIYTVVKRKGEESKWFCPSVLFFLLAVIPAIWIMELELLDQRLASISGSAANATADATSNNNLEVVTSSAGLSSDEWVLVLEQLLLFVLIIGRWMLPKGEITRDQLSQLLLVYLGMAADIIEIFEAFNEENVMYNRGLIIGLMTLWSWALMQFTLVYTATRGRRYKSTLYGNEDPTSPRSSPSKIAPSPTSKTVLLESPEEKPKYNRGAFKKVSRVVTMAMHWQSGLNETGRSTEDGENILLKSPVDPNRVIPVRRDDEEEEDQSPTCTCLESDTWAIVAALLMQDLPFLTIRVILIARYQVLSYLNIFFTCKNLLVITLQVYRLIVVQIELRKKEEEDEEKQMEIAAGLLAAKFGYRFPVAFVDPYAAAMGPGGTLPYGFGNGGGTMASRKREVNVENDNLDVSFR
ncbi:transmembrane protein 26-like [Amphiura filiformis]|uniref:transmembrane protein 26-like n=1 Tax=Amphiura filiformis TaxID=82378 RepID=UPI003B20F15F